MKFLKKHYLFQIKMIIYLILKKQINKKILFRILQVCQLFICGIISENNKLKYEIQLEDEIYKVSSPSTVFIPKGVKHKARFLSGKGIFVCIILSGKYTTSKQPKVNYLPNILPNEPNFAFRSLVFVRFLLLMLSRYS